MRTSMSRKMVDMDMDMDMDMGMEHAHLHEQEEARQVVLLRVDVDLVQLLLVRHRVDAVERHRRASAARVVEHLPPLLLAALRGRQLAREVALLFTRRAVKRRRPQAVGSRARSAPRGS